MQQSRRDKHLLTVGRLASWSGASRRPSVAVRGLNVTGVNNDSRTLHKGEVFVALSTDKDDGHRFVSDALKRGAVAALVEKKKMAIFTEKEKERLIPVDDTLVALHRIALGYRLALGIPLIAITGSSGKTTARAFIASVLKQRLTVGETAGNLNNHIGVPISMLRFRGNEDIGVLEMGANHAGEIHRLSKTVMPTTGVITNIGYAHIGYFGSLANIARAKLEIIDGMKGQKSFLMLNGDDRMLVDHASRIRREIVYFGFSSRCTIRARNVRIIDGGRPEFEVDTVRYRLSMPGRHFIYSALLAIYLGRYFDIGQELIEQAIGAVRPVAMRGTVERKHGAVFIVDCYNANPSSMKNALRQLIDVAGSRNKVAVVGDMLELGVYSRRLHRQLGKWLVRAGVRRILAVGSFAPIVAQGALQEGMRSRDIVTAPDSARALASAKRLIRPGDVVLLKGSRGVRLETVYEGLNNA